MSVHVVGMFQEIDLYLLVNRVKHCVNLNLQLDENVFSKNSPRALSIVHPFCRALAFISSSKPEHVNPGISVIM